MCRNTSIKAHCKLIHVAAELRKIKKGGASGCDLLYLLQVGVAGGELGGEGGDELQAIPESQQDFCLEPPT